MTKRPKCHSEPLGNPISISFQDINKWNPKKTKVRNCFHCKEILMFNFFKKNASELGFSKEQTFKIWDSKHIQLYCCDCIQDLKEIMEVK